MLKRTRTAALQAGRLALRVAAAEASWLDRMSRAAFVLALWPMIFAVLATIAGLVGWYGPASGAGSTAGKLFSMMLVLFILVMSQALVGRDVEL